MAETPVIKAEVKEIVNEAVEELAGLINRGFTEQQGQINELNSGFQEVRSDLKQVKSVQSGHSDELGQIKGMLSGQQKLIDYHDREIERILKHEKLEPSALEE